MVFGEVTLEKVQKIIPSKAKISMRLVPNQITMKSQNYLKNTEKISQWGKVNVIPIMVEKHVTPIDNDGYLRCKSL